MLSDKKIITLCLISLTFLVSLYLYFIFPDSKMITHWNWYGVPDGLGSKFLGFFSIPLAMVFVFLLFMIFPRIDPFEENLKKARELIDALLFGVVIVLVAVQALVVTLNFGWSCFNITRMMVVPIVALLLVVGSVIKEIDRNWFIGIRTPWTLTDEEIWRKTNQLGGKLIMCSSLLMILGVVFVKMIVWLLLGLVLFWSVYLTAYSYFLYRKLKTKELEKK